MASIGSDQLTGGSDASARAAESVESPTTRGQSEQSTGAVGSVTLPQQPAAPNGATVVSTQHVLTLQTKRAPATGTKSNFRLLLEAGHANVHGWWGKNGRLNYARKCITDIPKGFLQGVLTGLLLGIGCLVGSAVDKGRTSKVDSEAHYLGYYWHYLTGLTQGTLLRALGTQETMKDLDDAILLKKGARQQVSATKEFATVVKKARNVTYTPSKVASFGIGAAVGAAVPSFFALIGCGIGDLIKTREPDQAGGAPRAATTPGAVLSPGPAVERESDA